MLQENRIKCATRADVAKKAGVSVTVVSYVMNNNRYVDQEKRKRVLRAAKELHYTPNSIARALKGKSSRHIIFLVDNTTNERFGRLMSEMDRFAYEKGSMISLSANRGDPEFVRKVISRRIDGIIISSMSFPEEDIREFVAAGIPVVLLQSRQYPEMEGVAQIGSGLYYGTMDCIRYFYGQGRRHIIYLDRISQRNHFSDLSDNRYLGYVTAMRELGLEERCHMITGCTSAEEVQQKLTDYMNEHPVDAVLGRNDTIACTAMKAILRTGRRIPQDVGVIGWDDSSICRLVTPSLTSMQMQEEKIARAAVDTLYEMQNGAPAPPERRFEARMIVRRSTDPAANE